MIKNTSIALLLVTLCLSAPIRSLANSHYTEENIVTIRTSFTEDGLDRLIDVLTYENALKGNLVLVLFDIYPAEYFDHTTEADIKRYCYKGNTSYCFDK